MLRPRALAAAFARVVAGLALALPFAPASAADCSTVHPGARMGPHPNYRAWPYGDACYVDWPGGGGRASLPYQARCEATPGYIEFHADRGQNANTCIFRPPAARAGDDVPRPARPAAPQQAARPPASPDNPFASNRPSPDNPFAVGRTPAPDNPFRAGAAAAPAKPKPPQRQVARPPGPADRPPAGKAAAAASAAKPPARPDRDPGQVKDAKSCIVVSHIKEARYRFRNQCPFAVNFVYSGRNFQMPVEYTTERLSKAPESVWTYSYHGHRPEVVWACAGGTPGCDVSAALAAQRRLNGR